MMIVMIAMIMIKQTAIEARAIGITSNVNGSVGCDVIARASEQVIFSPW